MLTMKRHRADDAALLAIKRCKTEKAVCTHPGFLTELCIGCGRQVKDDPALASSYVSCIRLEYIAEGFRLSNDHIAKLKLEETKNAINQKKLFLVLDLDHTLLHTSPDQDNNPDDNSSQQGQLSFTSSVRKTRKMRTKLRPFVRTFLKEANDMFEMYIYTHGKRKYAHVMARFLDPKGVYFKTRVIAREDCTNPSHKGLDVVFGQERAVVIVDDTKNVWAHHKENLIHVKKYFATGKGGDESDGTLASVLEDLKKIHTKFFTEYDHERDVRNVLKTVRGGD